MALDGGGLMGEKAVLLVFQAVVVFGFVVAIFKVHVTLGGDAGGGMQHILVLFVAEGVCHGYVSYITLKIFAKIDT